MICSCRDRFFSFFGNLAGSLFIVFLVDETLLFQTGVAAGVANAKAVAVAKTSASFGTTVVRGLLCNWLVSTTCSHDFAAVLALSTCGSGRTRPCLEHTAAK